MPPIFIPGADNGSPPPAVDPNAGFDPNGFLQQQKLGNLNDFMKTLISLGQQPQQQRQLPLGDVMSNANDQAQMQIQGLHPSAKYLPMANHGGLMDAFNQFIGNVGKDYGVSAPVMDEGERLAPSAQLQDFDTSLGQASKAAEASYASAPVNRYDAMIQTLLPQIMQQLGIDPGGNVAPPAQPQMTQPETARVYGAPQGSSQMDIDAFRNSLSDTSNMSPLTKLKYGASQGNIPTSLGGAEKMRNDLVSSYNQENAPQPKPKAAPKAKAEKSEPESKPKASPTEKPPGVKSSTRAERDAKAKALIEEKERKRKAGK